MSQRTYTERAALTTRATRLPSRFRRPARPFEMFSGPSEEPREQVADAGLPAARPFLNPPGLDSGPGRRSAAAVGTLPEQDGPSLPIQGKFDYPIASHGGEITNRGSLRQHLKSQFGAKTSDDMLDRYLNDLSKQPESFSTLPAIHHEIDTRIRYDLLGKEKWREFIDAKDHEAALAAFKSGKIAHPGEFYDYRPDEGGKLQKVGGHFKAFTEADTFVSERLNKKLTAQEYVHVNRLATQGIESEHLKGVRTGEVTWNLPTPNDKQQEALTEQGLTDVRPNPRGATVHVPSPERPIEEHVQELLDKFYSTQEVTSDNASRVSAITSLYQALEAIHPFKDGTSRTNHLVLNKLLTESGLNPALLQEPNSPTSSHEEFGRHIVEGATRTQEIAKTVASGHGTASQSRLAQDRNKIDRKKDEEARLARYGLGSGIKPTPPPTAGPPIRLSTIDIHSLGGGPPEHIAPPDIAPISNVVPQASNTAPSYRRDAAFRSILGNKRIDQYLAYKNKKL